MPAERTEISWMIDLTGNKKGNRLLVLGVIDEFVRDMIHFGKSIDWSICVSDEVEGVQRTGDIHWLHPEYFDKVPLRDAPEFYGLLIAPSLSPCESVDRMVEKFRVRRIAIIQFVTSPDRVKVDDTEKLFETKLTQETWNGETKLFSLPFTELVREGQVVGAQRGETIQDCLSWLSR